MSEGSSAENEHLNRTWKSSAGKLANMVHMHRTNKLAGIMHSIRAAGFVTECNFRGVHRAQALTWRQYFCELGRKLGCQVEWIGSGRSMVWENQIHVGPVVHPARGVEAQVANRLPGLTLLGVSTIIIRGACHTVLNVQK